ncbi:MAG: VWA domain-containing protein [Terracidiphilus sp.]|nr:VWA domain-containing protein [Terracidiphilus sp.]MDR3777098.1 VWA domain-containing protein [Terracidiphilus sp.]
MRRLILLALLAAMVLPADAARRVTVAQLETALAAAVSAHRADIEVARQLGDLELTERLTATTLDRWAAKLPLEPRTALALQLLSDQSAFLDPPASELPATAFPDAATQQKLMDAARGYVIQTVPHLPNFFATRTTNRFDDGPQVLAKGAWPVRAGLHPVGTSSRQITFRDGREIQDAAPQTASANGQPSPVELGLHTWGEFGPALTVVLSDAAKGQMAFSHWEQTPAGLAAVFHYSVPKAASHYAVSYCCMRDQQMTEHHQMAGRGRGGTGTLMSDMPGAVAKPYHETPAYHGSLAIDPATGAILRITLEAELSGGDPLLRAATVVEYGPVMIGDRSYICPVRSLAFSMEESQINARPTGGDTMIGSNRAVDEAWGSPASRPANAPVLLVNETSFTHYHRLGTTVRMVADTPETATPGAGAQPSTSTDSAPPISALSSPAAPPPSTQTAANLPAPAQAAVEPAPPPQPVIPEITLTAANDVPDEPANAPQTQEGGVTLKLTSRLVDVGIVAYDKKGHPVKDLKQEDFEVYDNGRKQEIRFFSALVSPSPTQPQVQPQAQAAPNAPPEAVPAEHAFSNRAADTAAGPGPAPEAGATILLIDESHIAWADMNHARQEILRFLATLPGGERVGLYTMTGLGFRVLEEVSTDHAALKARLQKWMPSAQSVALAQEEETRNRQHFDEVHNVADLNSVNGNHTEVPDAEVPVDPQLLTMGSNPARASLIILSSVARHLSAVPGHKNLIWVSSDNVFADWRDQAVGIDKSPKFIDSYALRAQEAMNDAHAAVYPFDVSQLEAGGITADLQHQNVQLTQAAAENGSLGGGAASSRSNGPGRIAADMSQDVHPVQGAIRQVADATGGRVIRRAGDLAAQMTGVVEDGHAIYLLSFSPQGPADGQYHAITVKLTGKQHGLTLRYRTGYLFAKEAASLRERFQQAVWRPRDVSEISVAADLTPMKPGAKVTLSILAGDLGLQQQAGRWMDKLDIFFIQRDDAGLHAQVEGQTLGLRLRSSTYQNLLTAGIPFERFVQLKPGMASLRILVVDENSGHMGSVTLPSPALSSPTLEDRH